jgi:hypothetical protein|tara:strand:+ start:40 stop:2607 length:2568 start_codon:yes stop_codon:yes gene_type:complete
MDPKEAKKLCLDLLKTTKGSDVKEILKKNNLWDKKEVWREYGDDSQSWSIVGGQGDAEFSLNEKIVNGLDAVLMNKCWESGINPKTSNGKTPQSIKEAYNLYFKDKGIREIAANSVWVSLGGSKTPKHPCVCVVDLGEGQAPERMPQTILSLAKGNKEGINFVQGNWNTGGSGAIRHCGKDTLGDDNEPLELSMILSRRNPKIIEKFPEQRTEHSSKWSFTIIKRDYRPYTEKSHIMCLAPINSDIKANHGELLRFESDTLPILPEKKVQCVKPAMHGTLVKLFEYGTDKGIALMLGKSLYTELSVLLPEAFIPYMFHECRKDKSHNTYIEGFSKYITRLNNKNPGKYLECPPIKSFIGVDQKTISFEVFIFKKGISVPQYKSRYGLAWTVNGHTHALIKDKLFKQDFGADMAESMFVVLNCNEITGKSRENLFAPSRDRVKPDSKLAIKIKEELRRQLRSNNQIEEIERRRNDEEAAKEPEIPDKLKKEMQKILSENEMIELLQLGNWFKQKSQTKKRKTATSIENLKEHPTFFYFQKNVPKMELKDQHANIGSNYSYNLITDVVNDYFTRDENKGYFKFLWTSTKDKNQEIVDLSGGPDLLNGTCKFRVKIPDKFKAGERKILKIVIGKNENNEDFVLKVHTTILDKQKSKVRERILSKKPSQKKIKDKLRDDVKTNSGGNIDDQNISSELVLPVWVNRDDWELKTSHSFNEYEVLRLKKDRDIRDLTGKAYKYRAFLNEENIFLLKERKNERANYTWNMIKQRWWVYFLWLINGGLVQHRIDKSKNRLLTIEDTESDDDKQIKPEDVDVLEITARSVAMCVFIQQKNLLQNVSQRNTRSDQDIVSYDEDSTF